MIEKAQREAAQRKEKENVLQGAGIAITRKNDKNKKEATVSITLDKNEKAEFLEKAEKYLVSQMKDFLKNEGKDLHEVKNAVEQYEKNPNAETAARVAEAYEKTAVAIGAGFTPIAGDVIDGFIALKDVYRGDYLSAGISTAAMFTPFLPATVAKKISKAIFETPLGKKISDSSFGKWAIARFGKKADDVGEQIPEGILDSQKRNIDTIDNIFKNHAKPHDFDGVSKELSGEVIVGNKGYPYQHIKEMKDSVKGLDKSIKRLKNSLNDPSHSNAVRDYINAQIKKAAEMSEKMKKTLGKK